MNQQTRIDSLVPFSLSDAPAFIERQMPVGRVSAEAYKERKAGAGQTLTSLGSYWKGRKPLVLVRATILGCLLPATNKPLKDLRIFLLLMGMDDASFRKRLSKVAAGDIDPTWSGYTALVDDVDRPTWRKDLDRDERLDKIAEWVSTLPYDDRLEYCLRPEEVPDDDQPASFWHEVNDHLGTSATSVSDLVEQLGVMRYGRRPKVADTFAGGGSIPFEAARMGCQASGSDLNPIACLLTWGAFNVIGGSADFRSAIQAAQMTVVDRVRHELDRLGVEKSQDGARAKSYLYCVEARCTKTDYLVPVAPSWVISRNHRVVAKLVPRPATRDYAIDIISGASDADMLEAEQGTLVNDTLVHPANSDRDGVSMAVIRGDHKNASGEGANRLRMWSRDDIQPAAGDRFSERLYCIQWLKKGAAETDADEISVEADDNRPTFFAAPTAHDLSAEKTVNALVAQNLHAWQELGLVPGSRIAPGDKTREPIRTRGWTHWHHLFTPRHLLFGSLALAAIQGIDDAKVRASLLVGFCRTLNYMSRMTQWRVRKPSPKKPADQVNHVFYNQALNTFYNFGIRSSVDLFPALAKSFPTSRMHGSGAVNNAPAARIDTDHDIYVTDPPYADAVAYHEITEYFISWVRAAGEGALPDVSWDSHRAEAIKGSDEKFRADMVNAYKAMASHMPDNGIQVVMFTHQNAGVWADLASIMWAAGLRVTAAWNIVTETTLSEATTSKARSSSSCGNEKGPATPNEWTSKARSRMPSTTKCGLSTTYCTIGRPSVSTPTATSSWPPMRRHCA